MPPKEAKTTNMALHEDIQKLEDRANFNVQYEYSHGDKKQNLYDLK